MLITGGCGYIGSHIGYVMAGYGYQVVLLDKVVNPEFILCSWAKVVEGDYGDADLLAELFNQYQIDTVMHCASYTSVPESVTMPLEYYYNNVSKTVTLLKSMIKHNVLKIVFSSSCAVYGNPCVVPVTEDHALNPTSPYGTTKMMIEKIIKDTAAVTDLSFINLRYFNVAGAIPELQKGPQKGSNIIPILIQSVLKKAPFYLYGIDYNTPDGTCVRDYVHVHDVALAHYKAVLHLNNTHCSDTFNIGSAQGFSVKDIITAVQNTLGQEIEVIPAERRKGDTEFLLASIQKAANVLSWQPQYSQLQYCVTTACN